MNKTFIQLADLILVGLVAGILTGIWMGYNPDDFTYPTYVEYQQNAIYRLNTIMPLLGLAGIILSIISAVQQKNNKTIFRLLIAAAVLLIIAGLITRFGNQPINKIVMTWNRDSIPADWQQLRDQWWIYHQLRAVCSVIAFCCISLAAVRKS